MNVQGNMAQEKVPKSVMLCITVALSPTINMANSTAWQHAKTSASSEPEAGAPLAEEAAITSPLSFLIITPKPVAEGFVNMATLKFNLLVGSGGGCHLDEARGHGETPNRS